jgi:hypothetical protein
MCFIATLVLINDREEPSSYLVTDEPVEFEK